MNCWRWEFSKTWVLTKSTSSPMAIKWPRSKVSKELSLKFKAEWLSRERKMLTSDVAMPSEERMKTKRKEELEVLLKRRSMTSLMLFNMKSLAWQRMLWRIGARNMVKRSSLNFPMKKNKPDSKKDSRLSPRESFLNMMTSQFTAPKTGTCKTTLSSATGRTNLMKPPFSGISSTDSKSSKFDQITSIVYTWYDSNIKILQLNNGPF